MQKLTFCKTVDNMPVRAKMPAAPQPNDRMALKPPHSKAGEEHISPNINKVKAYTRLYRDSRH